MDYERFEELGLSPIRWAYQVHRSFIAAQVFAEPQVTAMRRAFPLKSDGWKLTDCELEYVQQVRAYTDASALLFGLALENAYKTREIIEGKVQVVKGEFKGMRTDHNILEMVKTYYKDLNASEIDLLEYITFATTSMGKYPIAKNVTRQNKFLGRSFGCDVIEPLARRIIESLMNEEPYLAIFKSGHLSGIPDTA